jgi:hypothetical protein
MFRCNCTVEAVERGLRLLLSSHWLQHPLIHPLIIATFRQGIVTVEGFGILWDVLYFIGNHPLCGFPCILRQLLPVHESLQTMGLGGGGVVQFKQDDRKRARTSSDAFSIHCKKG